MLPRSLGVRSGSPWIHSLTAISGDYRQLLRALSGLLRHSLHIAVPAAQVLINLYPTPSILRLEIDVPVEPDTAVPEQREDPLGDVLDADGDKLSTAFAAQVFEMHGGTLRTLTSERHQRFAGEDLRIFGNLVHIGDDAEDQPGSRSSW